MLRTANELTGYAINTDGGETGKADDFIFDDFTWSFSHLVADAGKRLFKEKRLIPPGATGKTAWLRLTFQKCNKLISSRR